MAALTLKIRGVGPRRLTIYSARGQGAALSARSTAITTLGIVLSRSGITTRNRDHANHAQNNTTGRSCHPAIAEAKRHVEDGYEWCVDLDLEKFLTSVW
jgi:hypothetical protein